MSSLKNAMKSQKTHRERHQPESRGHLGLLEKRKDYRLRAKDYNEKKQALRKLRRQALNANPDEFYHHMINSQSVDGVHREKAKDEVMTPEQVQLLQTRDLSYVVHKRTAEMRKIERLKANLHLLDAADDEGDDGGDGRKGNTHTFFVDSEEEKRRFDPAKRLGTHPTLLGRTFNRPRMEDLESGKFSAAAAIDPELAGEAAKRRAKAYKELRQRMERERQLGVVQAKMEVRRHLQNKSGQKPATLVKPETKESAPVLKWPAERKR